MRTLLRPHGDGYIPTLVSANNAGRETKVIRAIEKIIQRCGPALKRLAE